MALANDVKACRVMKDTDNYGGWVVMDSNFRDVVFRANTEEECFRWLRGECPTGTCED